jgi:SPP1 gp7 family putative phage head morphogenesis protein
MSEVQAVFGKAAKETVDYFERKRQQPSDGWETVSAAEQQRAFTVAQSAGFNILGDIQDAINRARDEGWSQKEFQAYLEPLLRAKGWWGKAVDQATGEILKMYPGTNRPVVYGSPARLRLIYDTNMASSYAAGRFQRQLASKASHPYLRYVAVMDSRTRQSHRSLHGQVWPVDHPFWSTNYPPNGYRCRCMAQSLRAADVPADKLNQGGEPIEKVVPVNAARDMLRVKGWRTPDGREIFPDPGFDIAPGNSGHLTQLGKSLERLAPSSLEAASRSITQSKAFELWRDKPQGNFPIAVLSQADAYKIGHKQGSRTVNLSPQTLAKQEREHPELSNDEYHLVQKTISQGQSIQDGASNMIYVYEEGQQVVVVKATKSGEALFLTSVRRLPASDARKEKELARLLRKRGTGGGASQPSNQ